MSEILATYQYKKKKSDIKGVMTEVGEMTKILYCIFHFTITIEFFFLGCCATKKFDSSEISQFSTPIWISQQKQH